MNFIKRICLKILFQKFISTYPLGKCDFCDSPATGMCVDLQEVTQPDWQVMGFNEIPGSLQRFCKNHRQNGFIYHINDNRLGYIKSECK